MKSTQSFDDIVTRRMKNTNETREQATAHLNNLVELIAVAAGVNTVNAKPRF